MQIHTCKTGERLKDIASLYGISEKYLRDINDIPTGEAADGEELLILVPTRTHKVRHGDSLERLCLRFGVRRGDIMAQNPTLYEKGLVAGDVLGIKCGEKLYGAAPTNGYFYRGCDEEKLKRALPYLTYVTLGAAVADKRGVHRSFEDGEIVDLLREESKIPLLRIYDDVEGRDLSTAELRAELAERITDSARSGDYSGVVLSRPNKCKNYNDYGEFLCRLRKSMIGCDLILVTEVDEEIPHDICELADGNILCYGRAYSNLPKSYKDGEWKCYADFAAEAESAKAFIDIPSLAYYEKGCVSIGDALCEARAQELSIDTDADSLISYFSDKKRGRCSFSSLKSVLRTYKSINELGFMGASFDIERTPVSHLMMYNACFKTVTTTTARVVEGCAKNR